MRNPLKKTVITGRFEAAPSDGWYFGSVQTKRGPVCIYLSVSDLEFTRAPSVWLDERPAWLTGWRPHLLPVPELSKDWLCYSDHESFQLLSHDPGRALLRVIEDSVMTLDRIADPVSVVEDSKREISYLWHDSGYLIFSDVEPIEEQEICLMGSTIKEGRNVYLISHDPQGLAKKLAISEPVKVRNHVVIFPEPSTLLYITPDGPPKNLAEVRQWLRTTAPELHEQWRAMLMSKKQYEKRIYYHFFRTGADLIGFAIPPSCGFTSVRNARQIRDFVTRYVHQKPAVVERLSAIRVDNTYLVRRNLPENVQDLRGKKVLLIGCGTIGGYLAPALVQLGAGFALKKMVGLLALCDPQEFTPQNVGRHFMGMNRLGVNKAAGLHEELQIRRPGVNSVPIEHDIFRDDKSLSEFDLIINATGYEPIGRRLSKQVRQEGWLKGKNALLHVWIEGRGGVVRTLLEDSSKAACFDCMWSYSPNQEPRLRYEPYSTPDWYVRSSDGYATMTPFSVSASHSATALAIDSTLSWLAGRPQPRFRSRSVEDKGVKPNTSCDLTRNSKCPLCSM